MADPTCIGGTIPSLQVINSDCTCVSIQSITWNNAGDQFTITLNNGQSITSPVLIGAEGATPVITFRVSGTTLQYNVDGGAWISLYDLSSILDNGVLANQYPALSTLGVAYESLLDGRTPFILTANKLSTNLDEITIHASFSTSSWTSAAQAVRLTFNGSAMNTVILLQFYSSIINKITIDARLTRLTNTTAKYEMIVRYYSVGLGGSEMVKQYYQDIIALAGLDFTANPYNIDAQGDSVVVGDVTCNAFEVVLIPKI